MIPAQTLGALNTVHELLSHVVEALPEEESNRRFHPALAPVGWLLGRAVYLETYWLRQVVRGDPDLTKRISHLFAAGVEATDDVLRQLPPKDHLLNWALEIQDTHLTELANPRALPQHRLLESGWLAAYLVQSHGRLYERMIACMSARALAEFSGDYQVRKPLAPKIPEPVTAQIPQGHYRIGARDGVVFDSELPTQAVELSSFRIAHQPVSNAEYLAFIQAGGYLEADFWDAGGETWRDRQPMKHPWHWRQDHNGNWYDVSLNGPADLPVHDPVMGITQHEARAYARWVATLGGKCAGAVLQHEYQWETAARASEIKDFGRVWEWCANTFEPYDQYSAPDDPELATPELGSGQVSLRGGCLHTQPSLRRASLRHSAPAAANYSFSGARLVFPPT